MLTYNLSTRIAALIHAADCARWLSWHGPESERAAHAVEADRLVKELQQMGVAWAKGARS